MGRDKHDSEHLRKWGTFKIEIPIQTANEGGDLERRTDE